MIIMNVNLEKQMISVRTYGFKQTQGHKTELTLKHS
mgnify:CR=1 FL=1